MFRGRKHARSARRQLTSKGIFGANLRAAAGTRSPGHGVALTARQLRASDTATLARHPSQQAAHHLPCGRPPDVRPALHPKLSPSPAPAQLYQCAHAGAEEDASAPPCRRRGGTHGRPDRNHTAFRLALPTWFRPLPRAPCARFRRPWYPRFDIEHACSYGPRGNLTLEGLSSCFPTYRVYIFSTLFIGAYRVCFVYSVFCFLARPPSPFLQAFSSGGLFFLFCFFSRTVTLHLSPLPAARQNGAIDLQGDQNYVSTHVYLVHMYT